MKTAPLLAIALFGMALAPTVQASDRYANQQLMVNPFMEENYDGWTPISPWRDNGDGHSMVFDFKPDGPTGYFVARQATSDLKTSGQHTKDADFDPKTARLTGLQFQGVFLANAARGNDAGNLKAQFYIEIDIVTEAGTYRAKSLPIEDPWLEEDATRLDANTDYEWETSEEFLGYPFAGDGLALAEIQEIDVKYVMGVETKNAGAADPVFSTIDNASIEYAVTVP